MANSATVKLLLPDGLKEVSFVPGEGLCPFLERNDISVEEFTVVYDGTALTAEEVKETVLHEDAVVAPVPEVTNG